MTTPNPDYWHHYFDADTIARAERLIETHTITSGGVDIHIDHYPQPDPSTTTLIFNHGGGGYSRIFVALTLALHAAGLRIIVSDQYGQGYSGGPRGDFRVHDCVQSIVDVAHWTRDTFDGPLFMAGGSVGSAFTYAAATWGAPADGLILHNLYDFSNPADVVQVSRFAPLAGVPGVPQLMRLQMQAFGALVPRLKIPFAWLGNFKPMVDSPDFYRIWKDDPYPIRAVSLRYLRSMFTLKPGIPLPDNTLPALVINPTADKMTAPQITQRNAERLGGDVRYVEIDAGHWSVREAFITEWVSHVTDWMGVQGGETSAS
jgi:pimeloyl-ACP methyl ester carboxylesterase